MGTPKKLKIKIHYGRRLILKIDQPPEIAFKQLYWFLQSLEALGRGQVKNLPPHASE